MFHIQVLDGDDVSGSFSGTFSNANVGSNKTVNISSSYSGADVGNYTITDQSTTTGNIIAKSLTATASASDKTYMVILQQQWHYLFQG